jgi:outer membrane protein OmpA-like peptidoglycan-associated protein
MKLRSALLAATVLVAPVAAKAQAISGIYIGAGVGGNIMQQEDVTSLRFPQRATSTPSGFNGSHVNLDGGIVGLASIGYGLGNGLRFEVEGSYRKNQIERDKKGPLGVAGGGDEYKYAGMVNALYDFDLSAMGLPVPLMPYVGVGVGYGWAQDKNARFYGYGGPGVGNTLLRSNDGEGGFAYQAILGTAVPIAAVPGLALTFEYRFMGIEGDRTYNYQYTQGGPAPGFFTRAKLKENDDYNHSFLVGVRYAFNAAPAPMVAPSLPPVVQGVARTYLVFFDWDRADLTDRARQIIAEAASATTKTAVTKIMVSGNTDTTGTARYNQALSVRRAQNVAAELVRLGVPRAAITAQGFGFTRLLVPTGPGVREPQNRRVEIVLQ